MCTPRAAIALLVLLASAAVVSSAAADPWEPAKGSALDIPAEPLAGCQHLLARSARLGPLCGSQREENSRIEPHGGPIQSRGGYLTVQNRAQYDRGYREGYQDGEQDARRGRVVDFGRDPRFRRGSDDFRSGYFDGYRVAYERFRPSARDLSRRGGPLGFGRAPVRGGYQDPAFARGYSDGYERGLDDGRDNDRYDPVRHRDYRNGDDGYFGGYGSRDAYKNNYRAGFRQGYEGGYRDGRRRGGR